MRLFLFFAIYFVIIIAVQKYTKQILNNLEGEENFISKFRNWISDPKIKRIYSSIKAVLNIMAFFIVQGTGFISSAILLGIFMGFMNSLD